MAKDYPKYPILPVVEKMGYEVTNGHYMHCPFCDPHHKYRKTLHLREEKDDFNCNCCHTHGGTLAFFSKLYLGEDLPSDKDGRIKVSKALHNFMTNGGQSVFDIEEYKKNVPKKDEIAPGPDDMLHAVYSAMLEIPELNLTETHKKDLMRRGLSKEAIVRNQYRSIPMYPNIPDYFVEMYNDEGGDEMLKECFKACDHPSHRSRVQFGLFIAHILVQSGYSLYGVPGFYKFGNQWCWYNTSGIMIPTRNMHKQIVQWQVRRRSGEPKYMTLHNGKLPGAVNTTVTRSHFPLCNAPIDDSAMICFSEGSLKVDVAIELMQQPCVFIAIPGVEHRDALLKPLSILKRAYGITTIYDAFDMDRLTNPNVRRALQKMYAAVQELGVEVKELYWGLDYARYKLKTMECLARVYRIPLPEPAMPNHFDSLDMVCQRLAYIASAIFDTTEIDPCVIGNSKNDKVKYYWEPETKGIDDYLYSTLYGNG